MTPSDQANRQFWASRRQERPKPPVKLLVSDFVMEANRQLRADKAYVEGTRFVVARSPTGVGQEFPSWEGPEDMRPLIQRILQSMNRKFESPVPFRIDRG